MKQREDDNEDPREVGNLVLAVVRSKRQNLRPQTILLGAQQGLTPKI